MVKSFLSDAKRALVIGIGGGGDVVGALAVARQLEALGLEARVGGVSWERAPIDPAPGPRTLQEIVNIEEVTPSIGLANSETHAHNGIYFAESRMAGFLDQHTVLVDPSGGPKKTAEALDAMLKHLGCDLLTLVDVGGDALAEGHEHGLSSPLCDSVLMASAFFIPDQTPVLGAIFGPCGDGELSVAEVLERFAEIAGAGAMLELRQPEQTIWGELERAVQVVPTEASAQALLCAKGKNGTSSIRGGRRKLQLTPLGAMTFFFDARQAISTAVPIATMVKDAESLEEANSILAKAGIKSELSNEQDGLYD